MTLHSEFDIKVVGFCKESELINIKKIRPNLEIIPIVTKGGFITNCKRVTVDILGKIFKLPQCDNSFYKHYNIIRKIKELSFQPDVIILEWTNIVLMYKEVKLVFPSASIIASEHDVNFLGLLRKYEVNKTEKYRMLYEQEKMLELNCLNECNHIFVQNEKDKKLLTDNNIQENKIIAISPYFHDMSYIKRSKINQDILFWGAMYRPENYEAAIWFIKKVMPLLADTNARFIIAGNRPPKVLTDLASEKIVVTGFIEDESNLFSHSLCFVSPLLTGAGIKVKIIEALSSGIPVLTNSIGIEGIPAENGIDYYYCEEPQEYNMMIRKLMKENEEKTTIDSRRYFVKNNYNLALSAEKYKNIIENSGK